MTDNEIVKALEGTSYHLTATKHKEAIYEAVDLINRQKAQIAELESESATLKHSNINLQELYYAEKEKVAKSKQKVIDVCRQLQTAKAEIEMDDVEIKELRIALQGYLDDLTKERNLYKKSIEELNQANAEIERLKQIVGFTPARGSRKSPLLNAVLDNVRAEAYREFAEKINAEAEKVEIDREGDFVEAENKIYYTVADWCNATSDNLLKELVGDDDG